VIADCELRIADCEDGFESMEICWSGPAVGELAEHEEHPLPQPADFLPAKASQARRAT
jgi:hypothetical protein